MSKFRQSDPVQPLSLLAFVVSIPAFYLVLTGGDSAFADMGRMLYASMVLLLAADLWLSVRRAGNWSWLTRHGKLDVVILLGGLVSVFEAPVPWSVPEWVWRLALCGLIFFRLFIWSLHWIA